MKSYCIFVKRDPKTEVIEDVVLVRDGFNFKAMLFNTFWFLYHKLWLAAGVSALVLELLFWFFRTNVYFVLATLGMLFIGFEANNVLIYKFRKNKDYFFAGYALGRDEKEAKMRFLDDINAKNKDEGRIVY